MKYAPLWCALAALGLVLISISALGDAARWLRSVLHA